LQKRSHTNGAEMSPDCTAGFCAKRPQASKDRGGRKRDIRREPSSYPESKGDQHCCSNGGRQRRKLWRKVGRVQVDLHRKLEESENKRRREKREGGTWEHKRPGKW